MNIEFGKPFSIELDDKAFEYDKEWVAKALAQPNHWIKATIEVKETQLNESIKSGFLNPNNRWQAAQIRADRKFIKLMKEELEKRGNQ